MRRHGVEDAFVGNVQRQAGEVGETRTQACPPIRPPEPAACAAPDDEHELGTHVRAGLELPP
jgi:hypothetical protein